MDSTRRTEQRWWLALLALAATALFLLLHPYRGLVHDGRLYTFQALSHLRPDLYSNDIFVLLGSQDDFTIFSPLYAWLISHLGVEAAASTLTLSAILLLLLATFALARELLSGRQAWVSVLLLVIIPSNYGTDYIFHVIEEFVTPRQLAEALALFSLLAWVKQLRVLGGLLAVAAMAIHPIMGLAGVAFLIAYEWLIPNWGKLWRLGVIAGIAVACIVALGVANWLPLAPWQFDPEWYRIVMSRLYLSLYNWDSEAWARVVTVFVTLTIASLTLNGRLQRTANAAFLACGLLLLLAFVGGDLLRIVVILQAQPWRALWLATVLAIVLLPAIYTYGWRASRAQRAALLLLAAAWAAPNPIIAFACAGIALTITAIAARADLNRYTNLMLFGGWAALALSVAFTLADVHQTLGQDLNRMGTLPPALDAALTACLSGVPPALAILAGGYLALRYESTAVLVGLCAVTLILLATYVRPAIATWTDINRISQAHAAFAQWRERIPIGTDVLWAGENSDRESGALNAWLLLERPSFISRTQASNALFSRPAAIEMQERSDSLRGLIPFHDAFRSEPTSLKRPLRLERLCRNTKVRHVVTREDLVDAVAVPAPHSAGPVLREYKLYSCP